MDDSIVSLVKRSEGMLTPTGWPVKRTTTMMMKMSIHVIEEQ